jgi:hypothetical protein
MTTPLMEAILKNLQKFFSSFFKSVPLKGVCMSDFNEDLEAIRVHQIASGCLQNVFPIEFSIKIFRNFRVFQLFLKIFFFVEKI